MYAEGTTCTSQTCQAIVLLEGTKALEVAVLGTDYRVSSYAILGIACLLVSGRTYP